MSGAISVKGNTFTWIGPSRGAFDDAANWDDNSGGPPGPPGSFDLAQVFGGPTNQITITGNGKVAELDAEYLTVAGVIDAGSLLAQGGIVVKTGGGLNTSGVRVDDGAFTIGGAVTTAHNVDEQASSSVIIGVSTGVGQSIGWTAKGYFSDTGGAIVVEHGGSYLDVSVLNKADGLYLLPGGSSLLVTDDARLDTSGLLVAAGTTATFDRFAHVYATGSNFNDPHAPIALKSMFTADGPVSAIFDGKATIANSDFTGGGAILIGVYELALEGLGITEVDVSGSAKVTDSYTLIANGQLKLAGVASWTAKGGSATHDMNGVIQVGGYSGVSGGSSFATLSVEGRATLSGRTLSIKQNGGFGLGSTGRVVLGSGATRVGALALGKGGTLTLDGKAGGYKAATDIEGGTMDVERAGAAGSWKIAFESQGGKLVIAKGASVANRIAGFSDKASIDFLNLATTSATFKNDILTLKDKSKVVASLKFATSERLIVRSDGKGGTKVAYGGKAGVTFIAPSAAAAEEARWSDLLGAPPSLSGAASSPAYPNAGAGLVAGVGAEAFAPGLTASSGSPFGS